MKYKTLAVAVGSVILFAGCNDSLIFKRLNKTEEWLEAAEAKLKVTEAELESTQTELESTEAELTKLQESTKAELAALHESTEAKLASMRSEKDQAQADLRKAERSNDSLTAKNVALAAYKNKRDSADALAQRKYEESAKVEKLLGTWKTEIVYFKHDISRRETADVVVAISRPREFYGPLTVSDLSVRVLDGSVENSSWHQFEVASIAPNHIKLTREYSVHGKHLINGNWTYADKHLVSSYQLKLTDLNTCIFWCEKVGHKSPHKLLTGWPSDSHGEPEQLELEKVSS